MIRRKMMSATEMGGGIHQNNYIFPPRPNSQKIN